MVRWEPTVRLACGRRRALLVVGTAAEFICETDDSAFSSPQPQSVTTKDLATFEKAAIGQRQANGGL